MWPPGRIWYGWANTRNCLLAHFNEFSAVAPALVDVRGVCVVRRSGEAGHLECSAAEVARQAGLNGSGPIQRAACYNGEETFCVCFLPLRGPSSVASWPKQSISAPFIRSSAPIVIAHSPSLSLPFIACACSPSLRRCLAPLKFAHNRARSLGSSFPFGTLRCVASHSGTSLISPQVSLPFESPLIWPLSPLRAKGLDGRHIHAHTHTQIDRQTRQISPWSGCLFVKRARPTHLTKRKQQRPL